MSNLKELIEIGFPQCLIQRRKKPTSELIRTDLLIEELFSSFIAAEKAKKQVKDLYNKYNSWLKEAKNQKLAKIVNEEKVLILQAKVDVLKEILNGKQ